MPALDPQLDVAVAAMIAEDARFVIIGGFAVIANKYVRATEDIDFLAPDDVENDRRVLRALVKLDGVRLRDDAPLADEHLLGQTHLRAKTSAGVIDILRGGPDGRFHDPAPLDGAHGLCEPLSSDSPLHPARASPCVRGSLGPARPQDTAHDRGIDHRAPLDYETVEERAMRAGPDGAAFLVAGLSSIVGFKRLADRPRDRNDLLGLAEIHGELPVESIPGLDT
jgi:hypothetical protein